MPKVIHICGKICSGKTTYAKKLAKEQNAVRLNSDEIMLSLLEQCLGDKHEEILERTLHYLYSKSLEILSVGVNVIIDFGFWQRHYRDEANAFFKQKGIIPEWHYIDVPQEVWQRNIEKRNTAVFKGKTNDYFVDKNIIAKFENLCDKPSPDEMDICYTNDWR